MNKDELNAIINQYYSFDKLIKEKFEFEEDENFDLVVVSPTWKPHFVFNENYKIENLKSGSTSTYRLTYKDKNILFIKTGKGAPCMYDNLLLLRNIESPYIFLGSAGSLSSEVNVGDIFIPDYAVSGDGASLYFYEKFTEENFFQKCYFDMSLRKHIEDVANKLDVLTKRGGIYSTDTLIGEYYQLKKIIEMNVLAVEQETAAFGKCMQIMDKKGLPILVISDSLVTGQNYYEPRTNKPKYVETREKTLQKIINGLY